MEIIRLPFEISGILAGAAKMEGFATSSPESLVLEFRLSDTIVGVWNSEVRTREIPWSQLDRAECGLGFFRPWLLLMAGTMTVFDKLPSAKPGQLRLRIPWKHRRQLRALTSEINLLLSYKEADRYRARLPDPSVQS